MVLSISHYLNNMAKLANQWNEYNYKDLDRQRIYLKDIDCPEVWHDKLKEQIPPSVFYLNESTGEVGGPGSVDEPNSTGPGSRKGKGVARAGDLMSCLPPAMRADNLMCYIGHEGTYTPAHREMCASLGQNIMVEASGTVDEHGKPTKPGSSIWFMTETKDRHLVSEYWLSTLGHDIEVEAHFAQINAWKAAPFKTYVVEQKVGDFILIPPLAPHQVWNRGTRTMKVAWNRTTVETLELALKEALPRARMVCRDEQYKNKAMVMFALEKYSSLLKQVDFQKQTAIEPQVQLDLTYSPKIRQLQKDFKRLFALYTQILLSETLAPVGPGEKRGQYLPYDSYVTCSYCRCNIFNRFLTCTSCIVPLENGEEDTYDICMECYAMGRSCKCLSRYKWVEQFSWQDLTHKHEIWRQQIIAIEGRVTEKSPKSLQAERKQLTKKTLAQVCQEQLKARPWSNPKKELENTVEEDVISEEDPANDDGTPQKRRKKRPSQKMLRETVRCHISQRGAPRWKVALCKCGRGYHYGSLFRAFDLMPVTVMEDPEWQCPFCHKICSCGTCRKLPDMRPFEPNGTILGHDTRKVADPRSVESLVDFSHSNISWIKKAGDNDPHETRRLRRRKDEAAHDKSTDPDLDDQYVNDEECTPVNSQHPHSDIECNMNIDLPLDPMLRMDQPSTTTQSRHTNGGADDFRRSSQRPELVLKPIAYQNVHSRLGAQDSNYSTAGNGQADGFSAPAAVMVNQEFQSGMYTAQDSNGIIYQYPDPTLPQFAPSPQKDQHHQPTMIAPTRVQQDGLKRKRSDTQNIIKSDLIPSPKNDANEQYHHAQMQRALTEARRNDRFISAEAAMTGKSLRLILRVEKFKLAALSSRDNAVLLSRMEGNNMESESTIIVQSDVPLIPHADTPRSNGLSKRRKVRVDNDEDFSTRKKRGRKSTTILNNLPNDVRRASVNYTEISSDSEANGLVDGGQTLVEKTRKPRRLPSYLAQRSDVDYTEALKHSSNQPSQKGSDQSLQLNGSLSSKRRKIDAPKPSKEHSQAHAVKANTPIDNFPAEPLPQTDANADLSMLGPGETTVRVEAAAKQVEDNRRAKLRALLWAESGSDGLDSSTSATGTSSMPQKREPKVQGANQHSKFEPQNPRPPNVPKTPLPAVLSNSRRNLKASSAKTMPGGGKVSSTKRGRPRRSLQDVL